MSDFYACPACGGQGQPLGILGTLAHIACRFCGWQWSEEAEDSPDLDWAEIDQE